MTHLEEKGHEYRERIRQDKTHAGWRECLECHRLNELKRLQNPLARKAKREADAARTAQPRVKRAKRAYDAIYREDHKSIRKEQCSSWVQAKRPAGSARNSWNSMKQRCINPNSPKYRLYGGRGIKVCDRWLKFEHFLTDMGERPKGKTLDRINNDGNYEPGNCRWATVVMQNSNKGKFSWVRL